MCFSAPSTPKPPAPSPPPSPMAAKSEGVAERQRTQAKTTDTNKTGGLGVPGEAPTYKSKLGG
jgi:hypothetical protein